MSSHPLYPPKLPPALVARIDDVNNMLETYIQRHCKANEIGLDTALFLLATRIFSEKAWKEFAAWAGDKKITTFTEARDLLFARCKEDQLRSEHLAELKKRLGPIFRLRQGAAIRDDILEANTKFRTIYALLKANHPHLVGFDHDILRGYFRKSFKRLVASHHFALGIARDKSDYANKDQSYLVKLGERMQLVAMQFAFHTAKIPIQKQALPLHLCYLDYLWNNEPAYYRGDGGATIQLYLDHLLQNSHRFFNSPEMVVGLVSYDQFSLLLKRFCDNPSIKRVLQEGEYKTFPIVRNEYQYYTLDSPEELQSFTHRGNSLQCPLIDTTSVLEAAHPDAIEGLIGEFLASLKKEPFVSLPGALIAGAVHTKLGVGVYFFLKNGQNLKPVLDVLSNFQSATGAYPEINDLRRALLETGYSLEDAIKRYPFRDKMLDRELLCPPVEMSLRHPVTAEVVERLCQTGKAAIGQIVTSQTTCPLTVIYLPIVRNFYNFVSKTFPRLSRFNLNAQHQETFVHRPIYSSLHAIQKRINYIIQLETKEPSSQRFREIFQEFSLIAEEMICLFSLFNQEPIQSLETTLDHYPYAPQLHAPHLPPKNGGMEKATFVFNSGMACYNAFVKCYPLLLPSDQASPKPVLQFMRGCYFELTVDKTFSDYVQKIFTTQTCTENDVKACDIFCLDLYPNFATHLEVKANDVKTLIKKALDARKSTIPLTVILDTSTTIAWNEAVADIVKDFEAAIINGALNLVVINSLAKFALCGLDKFPGGLTQTYCHVFEKPNNSLSKTLRDLTYTSSFRLSPEARRFFSFFLVENKEQVEAYINQIVTNTQTVYRNLQVELTKNDCCLRLGIRGDQIPMMGLHLGDFLKQLSKICGEEEYTTNYWDDGLANLTYLVYYFLYAQANKRGLPLMIRPSFGFPHAALTECWSAIRLTIGAEDQIILKDYVKFFKDMGNQLKDFLCNKDECTQLWKLIFNPPKVEVGNTKELFEATPTIRKFIEHHEVRVLRSFEEFSFVACVKDFNLILSTNH